MAKDNFSAPHPNWERLAVDNLFLYAVFAISLDGFLLSWNPGVKAVLGFDKADFIGKSATLFFTPEDRAAGVPEREFNRAKERGNANDVRWHLHADGSRFWASGAMTALRNDAGELTGFAKVVRDSSQSKALEETLEALNSSLEATVSERTAELRRLSGELTLAEQVERQALAKTLHDSVQQELYALSFALAKLRNEHALSAADTQELNTILTDTVKRTREITTDLQPVVLEDIDICNAFAELANEMHKRHGLSVTVKTSGKPCDVDNAATRSLIYSLVKETLFNVVKHAKVQEALLEISLDQALSVTVSDKGMGFNVESLGITGTGLGLSGAHKRLSLFGGTLNVESTPGEGTQITMVLPVTALTPSGQR